MRLYTIEKNGAQFVAALNKDGKLVPLEALGYSFETMNEVIDGLDVDEAEARLNEFTANSASLGDPALPALSNPDLKICSPVITPRQDIICLGVNYANHLEELNGKMDFSGKAATIYFSKRVTQAIGNMAEIPNYSFVDNLDYEAELCVILGKDAKDVAAENAMDYVFGYSIINDITSRDIQKKHQQWYRGKSLDGYTSIGPCIVTKDELTEPQSLDIACFVNGEQRQKSNTAYMIQTIAGAIEELSQGMTLKAGTLIATGTPGGVGMGMTPPCYLKPGDKIECVIDGIGTLTNYVAK